MKIFQCIRDIRNWLFLRKVVKKYENSNEWNSLNLRRDWFYRIATVITLRKEDFGEVPEILAKRLGEFSAPLVTYFNVLNISEIVYVSKKYHIPDTYQYFLRFSVDFVEFGWKYILSRLFYITLGLFILNLDIVSKGIHYILKFL